MKPLEQITVSFYPNKFSKNSTKISVHQILSDIISGKYASQINSIRRYYTEGDNEAAQQLKSKLPCFTASGIFKGAHAIRNLKQHSNLILIDFDHVTDLPALVKCCREDSHTVFAFHSPTDGYKVAAYVDNANEHHREAYQLVSNYYQQLTGISCDGACKDESRLCYMSYDKEAYMATIYDTFRIEEHPKHTAAFTTQGETSLSPLPLPPKGSEKEFVQSYFFLYTPTPGTRNNLAFKLSCEAARRGYSQSAIFSELLAYFEGKDFGYNDIKQPLQSGYQRFTPINQKEDTKPQSAKVPKVPYRDTHLLQEQEEDYWEGEELRRNTPRLPDEIFENLPSLLQDCILENLTTRERDLLLLAVLTAYSAILPNSWGTYNGKRFAPNLFGMGIAPAGSGKSIAQWAGNLVELIQQKTIEESEQAQQCYKLEKLAWQQAYQARGRKKEKTAIELEPVAPPYKSLMMSATTSYTRMQLQMRDNGVMGGFMLDTEAQTLTTANKMDCGHFIDMLCKAFEHESISSSFKVNGQTPIRIERPRLSMFITGTTDQFYQLIESPENGLLSRILIYTFREDPVWKLMGDHEPNREDRYEILAHHALNLYHFCLQQPIIFHFTRAQWNTLNHEFGHLLSEVVVEGNDNLQAIVKRHGFMTMRIAMILTRLRQFEEQQFGQDFTCLDKDFKTALSIVKCCYEHSRLVLASMPSAPIHALRNPDQKRHFLEQLPEFFTTEEAIKLAEEHGMSKRTVMRTLNRYNGIKIKKLDHGKYQKL